MISNLRLQNFKNFRDATLPLGKLTVLVGTNASGKTNLIDAFRFLHGVGRGYTLAEVIGEKWGEGGYLEWPGIRGGTPEIAYRDTRQFALQLELDEPNSTYQIADSTVFYVHGRRPAREAQT